MAGAEVAGDPPEVMQHRRRRTESRPAAADADVEAVPQHEVGPPEWNPETPTTPASRRLRAAAAGEAARTALARRPRAPRTDGSRASGASRPPEREPAPPAVVERRQQGEKREQAREEKQAVHPAVDPVEQQHPAARGEQRRDDADGTGLRGAHREARSAARSPRRTPATRSGARSARRRGARRPREREVERRSASLGDDRAQDVAERAPADEERERLVLVGRPGAEKPAEHARPARPPQRPSRARKRPPARADARACLFTGSRPIALLAS